MVAKFGPQCAGMFVAAIFVAATSATYAEEAATAACQPGRLSSPCLQTVTLRPNFISTFTTDRPFKTIMIGNPKIVDATAQDDRTVVLTPQAVGETNIIFLDERNVRITSIERFSRRREGVASRVRIYNKELLTSFNSVPMLGKPVRVRRKRSRRKEPAELPRGTI